MQTLDGLLKISVARHSHSLRKELDLDKPKKTAVFSSAWVICTRIFYSIILVFLAIGCNTVPISDTPSLENGSDTAPRVSPTMIPVMPTFRDDFSGQLNPDWKWQNEDVSEWKVNENGWLEITGGDESIMAGGQQTNLVWVPLPEGGFEISIHLKSQPLFDFQRAGLLLYEDSENYVSLSRGYCMECVLGGNGIFLKYSLNGSRGRYTAAANAVDLYLMLVSEQEPSVPSMPLRQVNGNTLRALKAISTLSELH